MTKGQQDIHKALVEGFRIAKSPQEAAKIALKIHLEKTATETDISRMTLKETHNVFVGGDMNKTESKTKFADITARTRYAAYKTLKVLGGDIDDAYKPTLR